MTTTMMMMTMKMISMISRMFESYIAYTKPNKVTIIYIRVKNMPMIFAELQI